MLPTIVQHKPGCCCVCTTAGVVFYFVENGAGVFKRACERRRATVCFSFPPYISNLLRRRRRFYYSPENLYFVDVPGDDCVVPWIITFSFSSMIILSDQLFFWRKSTVQLNLMPVHGYMVQVLSLEVTVIIE